MKNYLVKLTIHINGFEKTAIHIVKAKNKKKAMIRAMEGECHDKPDYSEYPNKDACWDVNEFIYEPYFCEEISEEDLEVFRKYNL